MKKFTEITTNTIISIIKNNLKPLEAQGIKVEIVEPKFSDLCVEATLVLSLDQATDEAEQARKQYFCENCESIGLKPEHFGLTFHVPSSIMEYKIVGLDFHDDSPVLVQRGNEEKFYRMSIIDIKRFI